MKVRIDQLRVGQRVDLEGDKYADAWCDPDTKSETKAAWSAHYEAEYCVVEGWERESPGCIRVDFESSPSIGFPPDHLVEVDPDQYVMEASAKAEAIANANAHLNNAGLPTYSELVEYLQALRNEEFDGSEHVLREMLARIKEPT